MKRTAVAGSAGTAMLAILLLSVFVSSPVATRSPETGKSPEPGQETEAEPVEGPWEASQQHFAGIYPQDPCREPTAPAQTPRTTARNTRWHIPDSCKVQAMVAIVPDPVHTRMSLLYDRLVEGIQLSAQSMNYVIDRYWLPWVAQGLSSAKSSDAFAKALKAQEQREMQPGLLMFRWDGSVDDKGPRLLYVFLVADTSTSGINGAQFIRAVDYVNEICPATSDCATAGQISILGPTFSGSLASLRALTGVRSETFIAYSGTVSSLCAIQNQGLLQGPPRGICGDEPTTAAKNLVFHTLQKDTQTAMRDFIAAMLHNGGINADEENGKIKCKQPELAILSEAATTYGAAERNTVLSKKAEPGEPRAASGSSPPLRANAKSSVSPPDLENCSTAFTYPREIASLRNAYQGSGSAASSAKDKSASGSSYLPFNLADRAPNSSDEPPDFAGQQGPLSKEAVLMDFAAELRRRRFKFIGIMGSNVLDALFLAGFLRQACPDTRLFVFDADLLFERELDNVPYIGTLAVSTYPRFGRSLDWSGQQWLPRLPVADQYEQGQYNAGVLALRVALAQPSTGKLYEMGTPFAESPREFNDESSLPLWLTAVGAGGYWPVEVLSLRGDAALCKASLHDEDFSPAWKFLTILLCVLAVLHLTVLLKAKPLSQQLRDFALLSFAAEQRLFFINLASATLALALGVAAAPAWSFGKQAGPWVLTLAIVAPVSIVALLLRCVALDYKLHGRSSGDKRSFYRAAALHIGLWALGVICEWFWLSLLAQAHNGYGFFFAYRAVHLATGLSPLMPLLPLLAAVYIWSIFEIWRLRFDDWVRPRIHPAHDKAEAEKEQRIANAVNKFFLDRTYLVAFCVVTLLWLFFLHPFDPFQLFERWGFGVLYELLLVVAVVLVISSGFRLAQTWWEIRKLLRELERSRVRFAFSRLHEPNWSPIWQSGGQAAEMTALARSFEVLEQVTACDDKLDPLDSQLRKNIEYVQTMKGNLRQHYIDQKDTLTYNTFHELQAELADLLERVLAALQNFWKTCPGVTEEDEFGKEEKPVTVYCKEPSLDQKVRNMQRLEEFVALRYVAFIRGVLGHVRHLLIVLAILFSLVLISLNTYSFEPHQSLIWSFTSIFAVIGVMSIFVLMEAYKNQILSRITRTKPNELGLEFYVRVFSLGAIPLLTVLATHFPSIGRSLVSLLQPGLEALK